MFVAIGPVPRIRTQRPPAGRRGLAAVRVGFAITLTGRVRTHAHRHAVLGHEFIGTAARSRLMALWYIISRQGVLQYEMCLCINVRASVYNEQNTQTYCILCVCIFVYV